MFLGLGKKSIHTRHFFQIFFQKFFQELLSFIHQFCLESCKFSLYELQFSKLVQKFGTFCEYCTSIFCN